MTEAIDVYVSYILAVVATMLIVTAAIYVALKWRRAPKVYRAMRIIASANLVAGVIIGVLASQLALNAGVRMSGGPIGFLHPNPCAPDGLPATELGKAIVLEDQRHAGDPNRMDIAETASLCKSRRGMNEALAQLDEANHDIWEKWSKIGATATPAIPAATATPPAKAASPASTPKSETSMGAACDAAFIARHVLGRDLSLGTHEACISYDEIAEMCTSGSLAKDSEYCEQAFDFQRRRMGG
ncbi:MAG TPA: hypothetical protein VMU16_04395 [Candidatus Binataceae bacterium]|nr:hypothetical protein [Candidatus Binataceae bacterium]